MAERGQSLFPDLAACPVHPDSADKALERNVAGALALAAALELEEALEIWIFGPEGLLQQGRILLGNHPKDELDLPTGTGRRTAGTPGHERAGIALVVADEIVACGLAGAWPMVLSVLAEVPFGCIAKVRSLETRVPSRERDLRQSAPGPRP